MGITCVAFAYKLVISARNDNENFIPKLHAFENYRADNSSNSKKCISNACHG